MASTKNKDQDNSDLVKKLFLAALAAVVLYFLFKKKTTKTIEVTSQFVVEAYRDMILSTEDFKYEGIPLHIYLAQNTSDYAAVKSAYKDAYGANLTADLQDRLAGTKFAEYVNTLWESNKQAIF